MARAKRDYKKEEARRKELAELRGFKNRYQQRRAIETGKLPALAPRRIKRPEVRKAQQRLLESPRAKREAAEYGGVTLPVIKDSDRAQDWSDMFARSGIAKYEPSEAKALGLTKRAYTTAYLNAFVLSDTRYSAVRYSGGSRHLYYWFVTLHRHYAADEYETRYGPAL